MAFAKGLLLESLNPTAVAVGPIRVGSVSVVVVTHVLLGFETALAIAHCGIILLALCAYFADVIYIIRDVQSSVWGVKNRLQKLLLVFLIGNPKLFMDFTILSSTTLPSAFA